jgi:chromatin assembly factor 1 subunit A
MIKIRYTTLIMGDGMSGLSAMEMGQKAVAGMKKAVNPFAQGAKAQIIGQTPTPSGGAMGNPTAQPPSEISPKQAGGFDLSNVFNEKGQFDKNQQQPNTQQAAQMHQQLEQNAKEQEVKDNQEVERLRKILHQEYYDEFIKKAEGKDRQQEEPIAEKDEKEEQQKKQEEMKKADDKKKKDEEQLAFRKKSTGELGRAKG